MSQFNETPISESIKFIQQVCGYIHATFSMVENE